MKIYHTETQADYDKLMIELEEQGCKWASGDKPSEINRWHKIGHLTCVDVCDSKISYASLNYYGMLFPDAQIIKYKAKADEKMRFTKENVEGLVSNYFDDNIGECPGNLIAEIYAMDDTPEKVVVPKCFDEWFKEIVFEYPITDSAKRFALWKLSQQSFFGHSFEDARGKEISYETELGGWLLKNKELAIDAVLNGYTIEPEQLYYIPLPHLETLDGLQQLLSTFKGAKGYFASRPIENMKQQFTKEELEQVPEIYRLFAKPIEEKEG